MRFLLLGVCIVLLFVGSVFGTIVVLERVVPHRQSQPAGEATTPLPSPAAAEKPTVPPADNPPLPVTPVPAVEPTAAPRGPRSFNVRTNQQQYRIGDVLSLTASANQTCHLLLYDLDIEGKAARFFPSSFVGESRLHPGEQRTIPGEGADFDFPITAPTGRGYIHAICSWKSVEGMFEVYQTPEAFDTALQQNVYTHPAGQWVETRIPYQIIAR